LSLPTELLASIFELANDEDPFLLVKGECLSFQTVEKSDLMLARGRVV
jgi:hypothetical protein